MLAARSQAPPASTHLLRNAVQVALAQRPVKGALQLDALEAGVHAGLSAHATQIVLTWWASGRAGRAGAGSDGWLAETATEQRCLQVRRQDETIHSAQNSKRGTHTNSPAADQAAAPRPPSFISLAIMVQVYWVQPTREPSSTDSGLGPAGVVEQEGLWRLMSLAGGHAKFGTWHGHAHPTLILTQALSAQLDRLIHQEPVVGCVGRRLTFRITSHAGCCARQNATLSRVHASCT